MSRRRTKWRGRAINVGIFVAAFLLPAVWFGVTSRQEGVATYRFPVNGAPAPEPVELDGSDGDAAVIEGLPDAPFESREGSAGVWTGREFIVWGGRRALDLFADGAAYDPGTRQWRLLALAPLVGRQQHVAVWTGTEMLVWGGTSKAQDVGELLLDGAAYNPATDTWRTLAMAPPGTGRHQGRAVWTNGRMVVVGGDDLVEGDPSTLIYDAAADSWRSVWLGDVRDVVLAGSHLVGLVATWRMDGGEDERARLVVIDPNHGMVTDFVPFPVSIQPRGFSMAGDAGDSTVAVALSGGRPNVLAVFDASTRSWTHVYTALPISNNGPRPDPRLTIDGHRVISFFGGEGGADVVDLNTGGLTRQTSIAQEHGVSATAVTVWTGREWFSWGGRVTITTITKVGVFVRINLR